MHECLRFVSTVNDEFPSILSKLCLLNSGQQPKKDDNTIDKLQMICTIQQHSPSADRWLLHSIYKSINVASSIGANYIFIH